MSLGRVMRGGFTLLEMLIVVIVISILAAIVIPQMSSAAENAKVGKVLQIVDTARTAVQSHYADTGTLAREFSNSKDTLERQLSLTQTSTPNWKGPYLTHPLSDSDNPYGGVVRVYDDFNAGPVTPVGFDLVGRGSDTVTNRGQYLMMTDVSEDVAKDVDHTLDRGVDGNWQVTGRVEWQNNTLMVFLMDVIER
jgi:prepilin-type N-terminal cleavage/methylation domain-containing protein